MSGFCRIKEAWAAQEIHHGHGQKLRVSLKGWTMASRTKGMRFLVCFSHQDFRKSSGNQKISKFVGKTMVSADFPLKPIHWLLFISRFAIPRTARTCVYISGVAGGQVGGLEPRWKESKKTSKTTVKQQFLGKVIHSSGGREVATFIHGSTAGPFGHELVRWSGQGTKGRGACRILWDDFVPQFKCNSDGSIDV